MYVCMYVCMCVYACMCVCVRWSDGLSVAVSVCEGRSETQRGANSLSIATRIREALSALREPVALSQSG